MDDLLKEMYKEDIKKHGVKGFLGREAQGIKEQPEVAWHIIKQLGCLWWASLIIVTVVLALLISG